MNRKLHTDSGIDVVYDVVAGPDDIDSRARGICIEQTVEVTESLCRNPRIADRVVGRIESIEETGAGHYAVRIHFPAAVVTTELPQVLNVLYGNVSLKPGIRVRSLDISAEIAKALHGPGFGITGLRHLLGVHDRPFVVGALKPLGRTIHEIAGYALDMAMGGIDIIKDDHGITNQPICPFEARVEACVDSINRAESHTGRRSLYFPTVTGPADEIMGRALFAKAVGAGGVLVSPFVMGLDTVRVLVKEVGLPVMAHPALTGAFFVSENHGIAHDVLLGTIMRLAGSDLVIFPTWGGRFPFTREVCLNIDYRLKEDLHDLGRSVPVPAGGMTLDRIPEQIDLFGLDTAFLIGSALYERSPDLQDNARYFRSIVDV